MTRVVAIKFGRNTQRLLHGFVGYLLQIALVPVVGACDAQTS